MNSARSDWGLLLLLSLANFVAYLAIFAAPPILGDLVRQFDITYAQAGLCMSVYAIVRMLGSLVAGAYSDRYGAKYFVWAGLVMVAGAGYLTAMSSSYGLVLVWRVVIGIGATAIFIPGLAAAIYTLPRHRVNMATGIFFSSLYLGLSFAFLTTPILAARAGWQLPLKLFAGVAVAVGIVVFVYTRRQELTVPAAPETGPPNVEDAPTSRRYSHRNLSLMLVSAAYFLLLFHAYGMITWLPEYLREARGYSPAEVGSVSMLLGLVMIPGSVVAGWLGDRIGAWLVAVLGAIACALCPAALIVLPGLPLSGVFGDVFMLGLGTSLLTVPLTSVLTHIVPERDSGKAVGLVHTTGYAGSIISTYLGGYILTLVGGYGWTFGIFSASMVAMLVLLAFLRTSYRDARVAKA